MAEKREENLVSTRRVVKQMHVRNPCGFYKHPEKGQIDFICSLWNTDSYDSFWTLCVCSGAHAGSWNFFIFVQISFYSDGFLLPDKGYDVNFLLDNKLMVIRKDFFDVMVNIRRLSSESYASNPGNPVATAWTWYWQDESGIWLEYDVDHLVS